MTPERDNSTFDIQHKLEPRPEGFVLYLGDGPQFAKRISLKAREVGILEWIPLYKVAWPMSAEPDAYTADGWVVAPEHRDNWKMREEWTPLYRLSTIFHEWTHG